MQQNTETQKDSKMKARWYVIHAFSGSEKAVARQIKEKAEKQGIGEKIEEVLVPTEEVVEMRQGKKVNTERKFFPGYVLAKMQLDDDVWHLVKNLPKVTNFLGVKGKPSPISEKEAQRIIQQVQEGIDKPRPSVSFEVGEQVKVIDGPFNSFNGSVTEVNEAETKLIVEVSIFGRSTPVELSYTQVQKNGD